jgi:hypothetical protein
MGLVGAAVCGGPGAAVGSPANVATDGRRDARGQTSGGVAAHLQAEVEGRLRGRLDVSLTDLRHLSQILGPPEDVLGPARLMHAECLCSPPSVEISLGSIDETTLAELTGECEPADIDEAGIRSPDGLIAGYLDERPVAAAGFDAWPGGLGHVHVLVTPGFRQRGIGAVIAHAAAVKAIDAGLMPQWRAASGNSMSIRLGLRLGFIELGRQLSVKILNDRA